MSVIADMIVSASEKILKYVDKKTYMYPILEKETGVQNTQYEYGDVRRYGAIGDGVTDDTNALQAAFLNAKNFPKTVIKLERNKTYIMRGSAHLGEFSYLEGNNATILIDKLENIATSQMQVFWDNGYGGHISIFDWKNLTIDFSPELILKSDGTTKVMWLFNMCDCDEFRMNHVNIICDGDEKNNLNIFTFYGRGKVFLDNCYFKNTMRVKENGSILWFQSKKAEGYYARVKNCRFYCNTWDEVVSNYSSGTHDVVLDGCTIEKYWYDQYYNVNQELAYNFQGYFITNNYLAPTTFTDEEISSIYQSVVYQNCKLICKPINPDSTIGILGMTAFGNIYPTSSILKFVNCDIDITNICQIATGDTKNNYSNNIDWINNSNILFDNCHIKLSNLTNGRGIVRSNATNLSFYNCHMELDTYLCNQGWVESNICNCFRLIMRNNTVLVKNTYSSLFKVNQLAKEHYEIINNDFVTTDDAGAYKDTNLLVENTSDNGYASESVKFYHSDNAEYNFYASGNRINHKIVDMLNKFTETTT